MYSFEKSMASLFWPVHLNIIDTINNHAKLVRWQKENCANIPSMTNRFELYEYIEKNYINGDAIDYLEFGVYRGDSFKKWLDLNRNPQSKFFGFDSFDGLPEQWNASNKVGAFNVNGNAPTIEDARGKFIKGWFQYSLPDFLADFSPKGRLVIHNDSDLFSSTIYVLSKLDGLIVPGTILIFDEFTSPLHEFRAFNDYLSAFMRKARPIGMTTGQRWPGEQTAFEFL